MVTEEEYKLLKVILEDQQKRLFLSEPVMAWVKERINEYDEAEALIDEVHRLGATAWCEANTPQFG